jgi:HEAT repeat protein
MPGWPGPDQANRALPVYVMVFGVDMRGIRSPRSKKQAAAAGHLQGHRSFEWPLLIYPVLFVATSGILYMVSRSIERETARPPAATNTPQNQTAPSDQATRSDPATTGAPDRPDPPLVDAVPHSPVPAATAGANTDGPASLRPDGEDTMRGPGLTTAGDPTQDAVDLDQLQGADRTAALLRSAVRQKNHAQIKQCLAELVARGDDAVVALHDLITTEESDAALWAATALARIGSPMATTALLEQLAVTKNGLYREEFGRRVSSIGNHESWPLLLDAMMQTDDTTIVRTAGASLSNMADGSVLDEVMARYNNATATETDTARLAQLVRNIRSPQATKSLLSLAPEVDGVPENALQQAAIEALAKVGDAQCVSHLLRRLEASPPGETARLFNTITRIDSPEAHASLLYAAAGNKEVSAENGRTAAIYALKNFPDDKTVALLERIVAREQNEKVLTAATRTLDTIKRSPHAVTAKADALQKSEEMLPLPPLEK